MRDQKVRGLDALATLCGGVINSNSSSSHASFNAEVKPQQPPNSAHRTKILKTQHPVAAASNPNPFDSAHHRLQQQHHQQQQQQQQQLFYQTLMTAACGGISPINPLLHMGAAAAATPPNAFASPATLDPNSLNAVQQLAFYSAYQAATAAQVAQAPVAAEQVKQAPFIEKNLAAMMGNRVLQQSRTTSPPVPTSTVAAASHPNYNSIGTKPEHNTRIETSPSTTPVAHITQTVNSRSPSNGTVPIQPRQTKPLNQTDTSFCSPKIPAIAPMPADAIAATDVLKEENGSGDETDGKKTQKRAANRRSAQLSRKRKKQFIEELKEENYDLKRKEQILSNIPDLIVAFSLCGKILYVSNNVHKFLGFTQNELENSCFWDRLCLDSVRLLKAAFMDALVAKKPDMVTSPVGNGLWEIRLLDKQGKTRLVSLHGVVHFSGENPECLCSIRPIYKKKSPPKDMGKDVSVAGEFNNNFFKPEQSVVKRKSSDIRPPDQPGRPVPISDGESTLSGINNDQS